MRGNYQNNHLAMKMVPDTNLNVSRPYKIQYYTGHVSQTQVIIFNVSDKDTNNKKI